MTSLRVSRLQGVTSSTIRRWVVSSLGASTATASSPVAFRISSLSAATSATQGSVTPPSAGSNIVGIEPYSTVSINGVGNGAGSWSQVAGSVVSLNGSGATRSYSAPALVAGGVLRFTYTVNGQSATVEHVILPATELISIGGTLQPVRWLSTSELK